MLRTLGDAESIDAVATVGVAAAAAASATVSAVAVVCVAAWIIATSAAASGVSSCFALLIDYKKLHVTRRRAQNFGYAGSQRHARLYETHR